MPAGVKELDARTKPPEALRPIFKRYQRAKADELYRDSELLVQNEHHACTASHDFYHDDKDRVFRSFLGEAVDVQRSHLATSYYEPMPGLYIVSQMLPPEVQVLLADRLLHRDLIDSRYKTNVHLHYDVQYPSESRSFFALPPHSDSTFAAREIDKVPLSLQSFLERKLRWITTGGQYDWTAKQYPNERPPPFPPDIARLIQGLFPEMQPEAAIVNLYSPGDTLSLHRDVSEECDRPLVSISLGCDALFMAAIESETDGLQHATVRLRSGDVVYMSGQSRYAWHGVPQIIAGSCPDWLRDWPAPEYEAWRGWMANKRINLNVRQMYE